MGIALQKEKALGRSGSSYTGDGHVWRRSDTATLPKRCCIRVSFCAETFNTTAFGNIALGIQQHAKRTENYRGNRSNRTISPGKKTNDSYVFIDPL